MLTLEQIQNYQSEIQKIEHEKAILNNDFRKALFIEALFEDINYHRELEYLRKCDYENVANVYLNC